MMKSIGLMYCQKFNATDHITVYPTLVEKILPLSLHEGTKMGTEISSHVDGHIYYLITADVRQPWTNPQDCYFEYLIIRFDCLIIRFDYLIIG